MKKIVFPIAMMITGFILNGIAWSENIGAPVNTICLCLGLGLLFFGFIFLLSD
ncbi:hypothetical protein [Flavobacterium sp. LM4]|uniref:hypothetical protein n=1 Tax=Flavobacterium sp. LM4 TaxID=1938609 RepID=UPI0016714534|nr:hypothetical protein [Flavobacterium sp. LM4]